MKYLNVFVFFKDRKKDQELREISRVLQHYYAEKKIACFLLRVYYMTRIIMICSVVSLVIGYTCTFFFLKDEYLFVKIKIFVLLFHETQFI